MLIILLLPVVVVHDVCTDSSGEEYSKYPLARQAVRAPNMDSKQTINVKLPFTRYDVFVCFHRRRQLINLHVSGLQRTLILYMQLLMIIELIHDCLIYIY